MATLTNLIDQVVLNLSGYTLQQDRSTYLSAACTTTTSSSASPTTLSFGSMDNIGKGTIEVDEELMYVDTYDATAKTATISPWGRGYLGSTAATHLLDARVTISPTLPRFAIKQAINDTLNAMSSSLYTIQKTSIVWNPTVSTYVLPVVAGGINAIFGVYWQSIGPSKEWIKVQRWTFNADENVATWGAGAQTITIADYITPGRIVEITYGADATVFASNTDTFASTGFPDSCRDVVILGATWRMLINLDPARSTMNSPQADETNSKRPFGSSGTTTKQVYGMFQQRLNEEVRQQQAIHPIRTHKSAR